MPDNKNLIKPHDAKRISLEEPYEVKYWTDKFNVSKTDLEAIIKIVGDGVAAVQDYIDRTRKSSR